MAGEPDFAIGLRSGILTPEHALAVGGSGLWVYCVLLDWQTPEQQSDGWVRRGEPVQVGAIAARLGWTSDRVSDQLARLERGGYIVMQRHPRGLKIRILKAKKFAGRSGKNPESGKNPNREKTRLESGNSPTRVYISKEQHTHTVKAEATDRESRFAEWWASYPRKASKAAARKAYRERIEAGKPGPQDLRELVRMSAEERHQRLIDGTRAHRATEWANRPIDMIPHGATFLNRGDWLEAPEPAATQRRVRQVSE